MSDDTDNIILSIKVYLDLSTLMCLDKKMSGCLMNCQKIKKCLMKFELVSDSNKCLII